jgi:hypothetical protein
VVKTIYIAGDHLKELEEYDGSETVVTNYEFEGSVPFINLSVAFTAVEGEPEWLTLIRKEALMSPMKSNFTLTRDELIYLLANPTGGEK